ncbi:hypothetical protein DPMN_145510 [Dreissena polymorpha]|uniref:Uncharacterized protein n=1 Tax=Dreissena polymorpha TaxID=45954 RepID=A0A9D4IXK6_DREPO|nr:hypothetical protein DPMN_145510 [Dreissena polymorpha]
MLYTAPQFKVSFERFEASSTVHLSLKSRVNSVKNVVHSTSTIIIVTSDSHPLTGATIANTVFRSTDFGVTYTNLTNEQNITELINRHNGLQRHPLGPIKAEQGACNPLMCSAALYPLS